MTLSRTGILVFCLELIAFLFYYGKQHLKYFLPLGIFFAIALVYSGALGRVEFDSAALNRLEIWQSGLALFSSNPLLGVGIGNSGEIASAFLLPDDINCRTLINSHLTLLCELGAIFGIIYVIFITSALVAAWEHSKKSNLKFALFTSFCGLLISSSLSTTFDWEVLLYPAKFEHLSILNIVAQWANVVLFFGMVFYLFAMDISFKTLKYSIVFSLLFISVCVLIGRFNLDKPLIVQSYSDGYFIKTVKNPPYSVVIFDDSYDLKRALKILKQCGLDERIFIAKESWQHKEKLPRENPQSFILFGKCADFANIKTNAPKILISPPSSLSIDKQNIEEIYIPKWDNKYSRLEKLYKCIKFF